MTPLEALVLTSYFLVLSTLAVYGCHRSYLVYLYTKHRRGGLPRGHLPHPLPRVTVQLPVYNEMYVVERLIDAVCELEYPSSLLEVQVLDDSTDETREIAAAVVRRWSERGRDVKLLRRADRIGFKAGALEMGLRQASGDFVAVFDADFIPPPEFLSQSLPSFGDPRVGMVQARWGHVNRGYSLLTKIQAMLLDGHFVLEHGARNRAGLFFNFNGTAGLWRREAIRSAGGWQHDTLTEDLDLSYRAQLRGWKLVFLPELVCPAELPVEMNSFKSQQHRWAKGSIQTCRKLLRRVLGSELPVAVKVEALFHLTANVNYLLLALLAVLIFPAMVVRHNLGWHGLQLIDLPLFCAGTLSVANFYVFSQRRVGAALRDQLKHIPALMSLGVGLCVNNARAVVEAALGSQTEFARTPKYAIERPEDDWLGKQYRRSMVVQPLVELSLGFYLTAAVLYATAHQIYGTLPFLLLFQAGFFYASLLSFGQQYAREGLGLKTQVVGGD